MRYNLNNMDSDSFELLIRSLAEKEFGIQCEQFGLGPDGQREFIFQGDSITNVYGKLHGKTIGQAKFKYSVTRQDDYKWLENEIDSELKRFREKKKKEPDYIPDNYIFFTNIVLTPQKDVGVKDKINEYIKKSNDIIKNFMVKGYDEICALIDSHRDIIKCYTSFIMTGDILFPLLQDLEKKEQRKYKVLQKFVEREFDEDLYTRMDQAGAIQDKGINVENVFIDLNVSFTDMNTDEKFVQYLLNVGNSIQGYKKNIEEKSNIGNYVLVGGPGQGKSTICQFLAQIYRALFLKNLNVKRIEIEKFITELKDYYKYDVKCYRIPIKIELKEYAGWINKNIDKHNCSIISYLKYRILKVQGEIIDNEDIEILLKEFSWLFIFDGLDEVPETSNRSEVMKEINNFINLELREEVCDCIILGTTREQGYNDDFGRDKFNHLELQYMDNNICLEYLNRLIPIMENRIDKQQEYLELLNEAIKDDMLTRLMKTPLQATIIAIIVKSGGKPPHDRYSLFNQYYETVVKREKLKQIILTLNDSLEWVEEIHLNIAYKLQLESEGRNNASADIGKSEFLNEIKDYIEKHFDVDYEENLCVEAKKNEFFKVLTRRLCFIIENKEGHFSFNIRSIQEFFAATYLVKGKSELEIQSNLSKIKYSSYWRNVLLFSIGYIEIERRSLEPFIYAMCNSMNGADNLKNEQQSSENICKYGSWLALDILVDGLFKGILQNKYINCVCELLNLSIFSELNKISSLSIVTRRKVLNSCILPRIQNNPQNLASWYVFCQIYSDVFGQAEEIMLSNIMTLSEKERYKLIIFIVEETNLLNSKSNLSDYIVHQIKESIILNKMQNSLSDKICTVLLNNVSNSKKDFAIRKYILQTLIFGNSYKLIRVNKEKIFSLFNVNIEDIRGIYDTNSLDERIKITNDVSFRFKIRKLVLQNYDEIIAVLEEYDMKFCVASINYFINLTYDNFAEVIQLVKNDNSILKPIYRMHIKRIFNYMVEDNDVEFSENFIVKSKKQYNNYFVNSKNLIKQIKNKNYKEIVYSKSYRLNAYSCTHKEGVFLTLIGELEIKKQDIVNVSDDIMKLLIFVAKVELSNIDKWKYDRETIEYINLIIGEWKKRGLKINLHLIFLICVLIIENDSDLVFRELNELNWNYNIEQNFINDMVEQKNFLYNFNLLDNRTLIDKIIHYTSFINRENIFLKMIPIIFINDKQVWLDTDSSSKKIVGIYCTDSLSKLGKILICFKDENLSYIALDECINEIVKVGKEEKQFNIFSIIIFLFKGEKLRIKTKEYILTKLYLELIKTPDVIENFDNIVGIYEKELLISKGNLQI